MNRGDYNSGLLAGWIRQLRGDRGWNYRPDPAANTPFQGTRSNAQLAFVKSTDGGSTWTQPQIIAPFNSLGVRDPNTGELLRVGDGLEEVAIGGDGKLYVVWESSTRYQ